jgi:hypothetical protein
MTALSPFASLMLTILLFFLAFGECATHGHKHNHGDKVIARASVSPLSLASPTLSIAGYGSSVDGAATPCSGSACATAVPTSHDLCPAANNTAWTEFPTAQNYSVICDVDFPAQNIYPFILARSFEACMAQCETYNAKNGGKGIQCQGFVFAPERLHFGDDCYLKSSLNDPSSATISLIGATRAPFSAFTATPIGKIFSTSKLPYLLCLSVLTSMAGSPPSTSATPTLSPLSPPKVARSQVHGASVNEPTTQWVYHPPATPVKLESNLLVPGVNCDLITNFDIATDTGPLTQKSSHLKDKLADLSVIPHLSRDGGKGGELNGYHIVTFCDTAGFTTTNETHNGEMVSFVSSSVTIDKDWNGIAGKALTLVDGIGQWNDDVGRMRGYSPMTSGEESFNIALSGNGYRYAVWPMSSIIPLNKTHALQYAALVYDEVNMSTQDAKFTTIGNTLLTISVDEKYGPTSERTVKRLFHEGEVMWGTIGGIRSWGSDGVGSKGGKVYVFGQTSGGILVARADPGKVANRDSVRNTQDPPFPLSLTRIFQYEYWSGPSWATGQLPTTATSFLINQPVMDFDLIYSPHHKTFLMVYLTPHADNTFYYRYLQSSSPIIPAYDKSSNAGNQYDYVEELVKHTWSEEQILFKANKPPAGNYIYAGSIHSGYFGDDDITKGGKKMLISWTEKTGFDAATPKSGYAHVTAGIEWE